MNIQACTVNSAINTVENKLDLKNLEAPREEQTREGLEDIVQNLLSTFSSSVRRDEAFQRIKDLISSVMNGTISDNRLGASC